MTDPVAATAEDPAIASPHLSPALLDRFRALVTRDPTHEETREAVAPFTGNAVSAVAECGPEDVARAVEHARTDQREWGTVTPRHDPRSPGTFTTWYSPGVTGSPLTPVRERDVESPRLRSGHPILR
ncbi:aldehyde dehydrogenase family protein [Haloarchaeobius sp. DYHT-AS-18]|uniref:aldehyde dehydrogenase family protein n=1 Tax=Haloarchaeobius sp. DYHT-AS-18 TaxID=3446117 RepID=UPI003EBD92E6